MAILPQAGEWTIEFNIDKVLKPVRHEINSELYIGRTQPDQMIFDGLDLAPYQGVEMGVSRRHAAIRVRGSELMIVDLQSSNGTHLNGIRLEPDVEYRLSDGDELRIGYLKMGVRLSNKLGWSSILGQRAELNFHKIPLKGRGQRILIVEDDRNFSNLYRATFELAGYTVQCCHDVVSAIRVLNSSSPALVLLDLMLSSIHGIELCRYVRRDIDNPTIPVVVVSGAAGEAVQEAMEAGADVFVGKPTNIGELMRIVACLIHKSESENPSLGTKELGKTATLGRVSTPLPAIKNALVIFVEGSREPISISVEGQVLLGRRNSSSPTQPQSIIDLESFGAFEKGVSRSHARIIRKDEAFVIEDLGSSNGTFVNGNSLAPKQPMAVNSGDEIRLGVLRMSIYFVDDVKAQAEQAPANFPRMERDSISGVSISEIP